MADTMPRSMLFTSADLELFPDDGKRYEIIDGELHVAKMPSAEHQLVCGRAWMALDLWSLETGAGEAIAAPGVIFGEHDDVAPDVAWISRERFRAAFDEAGHFLDVAERPRCDEDRVGELQPAERNTQVHGSSRYV